METLVFSVCGGKWSVAWDGGQNGEGAGERGSETDGPTCRQTQEKPAQEHRHATRACVRLKWEGSLFKLVKVLDPQSPLNASGSSFSGAEKFWCQDEGVPSPESPSSTLPFQRSFSQRWAGSGVWQMNL